MAITKKQITIFIFSVFFVFLAIFGGLFFYSRNSGVNYLIPGVPYSGIYQNEIFGSSFVASVMDVLGYWGDERLTVADINDIVYQSSASTTPPAVLMKQFFNDNGYEAYAEIFSADNDLVRNLKKFVNQNKKIPVIVFQRSYTSSESVAKSQRVVIGVFDKTKKVVVHDNLLGNNYGFSYEDFKRMFFSDRYAFLAVWPSDKIKDKIKGPDYKAVYTARLEAMDKVGPLLAQEASDAFYYGWETYEAAQKSNEAFKKLASNENFEFLPSFLKVRLLCNFASSYIRLNQFDEAIKLVSERVLPINNNLTEVPQDWAAPPIDFSPSPYYFLSWAYLKKGQKDLAIANYKEMLSVKDSLDAQATHFSSLRIESLEKEISLNKE